MNHLNIGDKSKRYEIRATDLSGREFVVGWSDHKDGGALVQGAMRHPQVRTGSVRIIDQKHPIKSEPSPAPARSSDPPSPPERAD